MIFSKTTSRLISFLMVVVMLVGMFPMQAFAADTVTYEKANSIESGKTYVIVADGYAMTSETHDGYTNSSQYKYSGLTGTKVTTSGNSITSTVTENMHWTITGTASGYTIMNHEGGYLKATLTRRTEVTNATAYEGRLFLTDEADDTWSLSDNNLKSAAASVNERNKDYYLVFDNDVSTSTGSDDFFGIRSTAENITFYEVKGVTSGDEDDDDNQNPPVAQKEVAITATSDGATVAATIAVGEKLTVKITNNSSQNAKTFSGVSANTAVATVESGSKQIAGKATGEFEVIGVANGTTTITFNGTGSGSAYSATLNLTVGTGVSEGGNQGGGSQSSETVSITSAKEGNGGASANATIAVGQELVINLTNGSSNNPKNYTVTVDNGTVAEVTSATSFSLEKSATTQVKVKGLANGTTKIVMNGAATSGNSQESAYVATINLTVGTGVSEGGSQGGGNQGSATEAKAASIETSKGSADADATASVEIAVGQKVIITVNNGSGNERIYQISASSGSDKVTISTSSLTTAANSSGTFEVTGKSAGTAKIELKSQTVGSGTSASVYYGIVNVTVTGGSEGGNQGGTTPPQQPDAPIDGSVVVISGSDYQDSNSSNTMTNIMNQIKKDYPSVHGILMGGDYSAGNTKASDIVGVDNVISGVFPGIDSDNRIFVQGNHDDWGGQTPSNSLISATGEHDTDYYGVYSINYSNFGSAASGLDSYLDAKVQAGYDKPIFVISHQPLHKNSRNDNNSGASLFKPMNEAGAAGLTIIYMFGHNHSNGTYDDYLGSGSIYLKKGDSMMVAGGSTETLNFTYLNYGYVGYINNSSADRTLSMTAFEITEDEVVVKRYSANGVHNLKAAGVGKTDYPANTTVYQSPQTIALDGTVTPPVTPDEPDVPDTPTGKQYLIISEGHALTSNEGEKYTNSSTYDYYGFSGVEYTEGMTVTSDMLWTIEETTGGYYIMQGGKYLNGTYGTVNNRTEGRLKLDSTKDVWAWEGEQLKSTNASATASSAKYLTFGNGTSSVSTLFSVRSTSNATDIELVPYTSSVTPPDVPGEGGQTISTDPIAMQKQADISKATISKEINVGDKLVVNLENTSGAAKNVTTTNTNASAAKLSETSFTIAAKSGNTNGKKSVTIEGLAAGETVITFKGSSSGGSDYYAVINLTVKAVETEHKHTYGNPTYTGDGKTSYVATRACACGDKQTATAVITDAVTTPATCTATGVRTYTANFSEDWAQDKTTTETIALADHTYGTLIAKVDPVHTATELKAGMEAHYKCSVCQKFFTEAKVETTEAALVIAAPTHTYDTTTWKKDDNNHWHECSVCGNKTDVAEHKSNASATESAPEVCAACGYEMNPALSHTHDWVVTYTFAEDGSTCTAKRVCSKDATHTETATATVTSAVKTAATCEDKGTTTYTATFAESWAATQTKDVQDIAAIDHAWTVTYNFAADGKSCTATHVCGNDAAHNETATATITSAVKTPATCEDKGTTTYTATFAATWAVTQTKDVQDIETVDHNYENGECTFCGEPDPNFEEPAYKQIKASDIKIDDKIVIVGKSGNSYYALTNGSNQKTAVTVSGDTVTVSGSADALIWTVGEATGTQVDTANGNDLDYVFTNGSTYFGRVTDTNVVEFKTGSAANTKYFGHDIVNSTIGNYSRGGDYYGLLYQNNQFIYVANANNSNASVLFFKAINVADDDEPVAKTLSSIAVTTQPTKTTYTAGENFSTAGMVVTATYSDNSSKVITDFTVTDGSNLAAGKTSVTVSYTEGGVTKTVTVSITVNQATQPEQPTDKPTKVDNLEDGQYVIVGARNMALNLVDATWTGNSGNNTYRYDGFAGTSVTISDNTITSNVSNDMIWEILKVNGGYTVRNVRENKYLKGSYTNSGRTGILELVDTEFTWTYEDNMLKFYDSANSKNRAISNDDSEYQNRFNHFTVRSNGTALSFYKIGKEIADEEVKVTGITLDKTTAELNVGSSITLAATVAPANADNKAVTWTSSDPSVATVDANGKVTAVKAGNATITATTADGGFTAACAITVKAVEIPDDDGDAVYVAFTSDVHSKTTNKNDSGQSPYRLNNWLTGVTGVIGADLEDMVFCGDNADGSGAANGNDYWAKVGAAMDVAAENTHLKTEGLFLAGNHEWENGSLGNTSSLSADAQARAAKIQPVGKVVTTDNYILYLFGASSSSQSGNGFKTEDLTALNNYLISAPTDRPIFITSHFPIHNFGSRSTKNADQMIDTLNKYGDKLDLYFIWGHNHSQSDSNYDKFFDEDDTLLNKNIKFTYCAAGAMSDSEYQGSASVKGKGLVAKIVDGKIESLTYYGTSNNVVASYKPDYSADPEEPDAPVVPDEPGKVETLEDGFYVIANGNHALTTEVHNGYTNSNNYSYSGFKGADVTIADNKITSGATEAMVFEVKASGTGYTIKHVDSGKYLVASYTQNSNNSGWTGTLTLGTTAEVWEWNSSNGYLKSTNASNSEKGLYLVFDEVPNDVTTGTQNNLFGIRSDGNEGKNMDRIDFYAVVIDDEEHVHKYNTVVTEPTCTEGGYTIYTCSCGDSMKSDSTEPLGHDWDDGVVTAPTCTEGGYTTYTCDRCDATETRNSVDALGHTEVTIDAVAATCTTDGLTEGTRCSVCDVVIIAPTPVAALGHKWDDGVITKEPTAAEPGIKTFTCTVCDETETEEIPYEAPVVTASVQRISGKDRIKTALSVAKALKDTLGVEKFDSVIIATGMNEKFADALAGSYLANVKGAPILLYNGGSSLSQLNVTFIQENLKAGGTVYILGGTGAIPATVEEPLSAYNVVRLYGKTRYETNLAILKEAGVASASEILIATGTNFADSLSASAVGLPLMLVDGKASKLSDVQVEFLKSVAGKKITIIGGTGAVSEDMENAIEAVTNVTAERISGKTRHNTSVLIAQKYFDAPEYALLTYAQNFPDGLAGGPLAYAMGAPLLLTSAGQEGIAGEYITAESIENGYVLGGDAAVSDETARKVFGLAADAAINKAYYTE